MSQYLFKCTANFWGEFVRTTNQRVIVRVRCVDALDVYLWVFCGKKPSFGQ